MARFDLHQRQGRLVVDVQADIIPGVGTRLVIPLLDASVTPRAMPRLHPIVVVGGQQYVLATHMLAAVLVSELGPPVGSLDQYYDVVVAALDMIFLGF